MSKKLLPQAPKGRQHINVPHDAISLLSQSRMMQTLNSKVGHREKLDNTRLNHTTRRLIDVYGYTCGSFCGFSAMGFTI